MSGGLVTPWVISARGPDGLFAQAKRLHARIVGAPELEVADIGLSLAKRSLFADRAVVLGAERQELLDGVDALAQANSAVNVVRGGVVGDGNVVFLFPGQGSQWEGMALELLEQSPVFAEHMAACADALRPFVEWSLLDVLARAEGAPGLERIDVVQPVLFAVMVSLAQLWRACGVRPVAVLGHSQGEIAAAHVAGGLSLEDAARLVAVRSRILKSLVGHGGVVSIAAPLAWVRERIASREARISVGGVNGPSSVGVVGDSDALAELLEECKAEGISAREVPATVASHSPQVEALREELLEGLAGIVPHSGEIPFYSTVTAGRLDTAELDPAYWYRNTRETVQLEPVVGMLLGEGRRSFVEVSSHPVLTVGVQETAEAYGLEPTRVCVTGTLRRGEGGLPRFLRSAAEAFVGGVNVDWSQAFAGSGARRVSLPSYAFQRERYWLEFSDGAQNMSSVGQASAEHPLLGAEVALAGDAGWLFTGRLSSQTDPWLAEHVVAGHVLLAGTALLELALHAGARADCAHVHKLTLQAPLLLEEGMGVQLQVLVGAAAESGVRPVQIDARVERSESEASDLPDAWITHASGMVGPDALVAGSSDHAGETRRGELVSRLADVWPPVGVEVVQIDDLYEVLADRGLEYGPVFQGLECVWRDGDDLFAEVSLPEDQLGQADMFGCHPALLDAALHSLVADPLAGFDAENERGPLLPCCWSDVSLHASGASVLRVGLRVLGEGEVALELADGDGVPVASVGSLSVRPVSVEQLDRAGGGVGESLWGVQWKAISESATAVGGRWAVLGDEDSALCAVLGEAGVSVDCHADVESLALAVAEGMRAPEVALWECVSGSDGEGLDGEGLAGAVRASVHGVLEFVRRWLDEGELAGSCLVILTRGSVATQGGEYLPGLVDSAVWGLVRSIQAENPGRLLLVDVDEERSSEDMLVAGALAAIAGEEPQVAIRAGVVHVPRLTQSSPGARVVPEDAPEWRVGSEGTVLVTGGTGQLGALVARHLVVVHGVSDLLLTSRRGLGARGAVELEAELSGLGARVRIVECDVSDRAQVAELIDSIPEDRPLAGVVHAAGVLDDGTLQSPKVDGAVNLHELTRGLDLGLFVLFSSAAGVFGSPGQANYAAANAFLDALAADRRAQGLVGCSMAWGWWEQTSEMTAQMSDLDVARMKRAGVQAISSQQALELFDAAGAACDALSVPVRLDMVALRAQARAGVLPALLRELVRVPAARVSSRSGGLLARRLAGLEERDRPAVVLEFVRGQVAAVIGHRSAEAINPERAFRDIGFDSLLGVELRNRLAQAAELRLSATLVFDYPTPLELAEYLLNELMGVRARAPRALSRVASEEPIAIIGMGCRYPGGVGSPEDLWELVASGRDGIGGFPTDRGWDLEGLYDPDPDHHGTTYTREGGFIHDAADFDAAFFGISPREALAMDPQQRLLLEVCWETVEQAGIDPLSLRGGPSGVFVGISASGYGGTISSSSSSSVEGYRLTGSLTSAASGRVAYTLGLEGPAVSVDTACSSSLVALHLACQALRQGECSLALAGGVTVLSGPDLFVEFSRQGGLARDGRCKAFSADADGTGWSEGAGVLLVERLSDALRHGHPVVAVVRGSAVNQDGASNGMSAPNGLSQQRVIAQALANAGLQAHEIDAVEAHGTGTRLGDPIEAQALIAAYGEDRDPEHPLLVGSLKSNIGHTATAAGVGGVIKMAMALKHGVLPATLHINEPSTEVDWSDGTVALLTERQDWEPNGNPRRAGVSSFGISGTNAHVILEETPAKETVAAKETKPSPQTNTQRNVLPWVLSGRGVEGVGGQAARLRALLVDRSELDAGDIAVSLINRPVFEHRAVVLGEDREELLDGLGVLEVGGTVGGVAEGVTPEGGGGGLAFLFTGQGAQRVGMGSGLYERFPVFKSAFDEVCERLDVLVGRSLRDVVFGLDEVLDGSVGISENGPGSSCGGADRALDPGSLDETLFTQTGLFALEVALFRLLESFGVKPDYLLGHSVGELVAAHVAGVLSLDDACALVAARGRLMGGLPAGGAMVAVQASESEALESLGGFEGRVVLAAVNGPRSVVFSGDEGQVAGLEGVWRERGRRIKRLVVSHAFHSPRMDGMLDEFAEVARGLSFSEPAIPIVSNLTGEAVDHDTLCSAEYWVRHARETVRFADGVNWLRANRVSAFLELGPEGVLSAMVQECVEGESEGDLLVMEDGGGGSVAAEPASVGGMVMTAPVLRPERPEDWTLLGAVAQMWVCGMNVEWESLFADSDSKPVTLPTYAFQRERYWLEASRQAAGDAASMGLVSAEHPLLGASVALAGRNGRLFTGHVSLHSQSWLADYVVAGSVLLAGTAFLELALRAGSEVECGLVEELLQEIPLVLPEQGAVQLQVRVGEPDESARRSFEIYSRPESEPSEHGGPDSGWTRNASGMLAHGAPERAAVLEQWPPPGADPVELDGLYEALAELGFEYGPLFQRLSAAWRSGDELFAEVSLAEAQHSEAPGFLVHPALLDASLHVIGAGVKNDGEGRPRTPYSWSGVSLHAVGASTLRVHLSPIGPNGVSMTVADGTGMSVASIDSLQLREISPEQLGGAQSGGPDSLYGVQWVELARASGLEDSAEGLVWLGDSSLAPGADVECHRDLESLRRSLGQDMDAPQFVVAPVTGIAAEDHGGVSEKVHDSVLGALGLVQEWLSDERLAEGRLMLVSSGAVCAQVGEALADLAGAAVWGLVGSAQSENPGRLVLVDVDRAHGLTEDLTAALASGEDRVAVRDGRILAARLVREDSIIASEAPAQPMRGEMHAGVGAQARIDPHGTVLITGGTGGLGALLAEHLVSTHGVRRLLLSSRRGSAAEGAADLAQRLGALGAEVQILGCDVSDRDQLKRMLDGIDRQHPLSAVIHAAGVLDDGLFESLTAERVRNVLAAKVQGAWNLHELTSHIDLQAFVLFSSIAGLLGAPGQASYAAANSFLDALAAQRRTQGLPGVSFAWGPWAQVGGMADRLAGIDGLRIENSGIVSISPEQGLKLFDDGHELGRALVVAVKLDKRKLRRQAADGVLPALLRAQVHAPVARAAEGLDRSLVQRLQVTSGAQRASVAIEIVSREVATVLGHPSASAIDPERTFKDLGFDSLTGVELRNRLSVKTGLRLPATLVFDHPTCTAVSECVLAELDRVAARSAPSLDQDLGQLERRLSSIAADESERAKVTVRLEALLSKFRVQQVAHEDEDIAEAGADEVFELIDRELGSV